MNRLWYLIAGMFVGSIVTTGGAALASRVPTAQDSVQQSPGLYRVLLDNDEVRVLSTDSSPARRSRCTRTRTGSSTASTTARSGSHPPTGK